MTTEAWAVKDDGELLVNTISETKRAAAINFLVVARGLMIFADDDDAAVAILWEESKGNAELVRVTVMEVI